MQKKDLFKQEKIDSDTVGHMNTAYNHIDESYIPNDNEQEEYDYVNHPSHYNDYDCEVIDMMHAIWGPYQTAIFCKLNAFKYRMRMGNKPDEDIVRDYQKEQTYLNWYKIYYEESKLIKEGNNR
jgi:hypothetical protein